MTVSDEDEDFEFSDPMEDPETAALAQRAIERFTQSGDDESGEPPKMPDPMDGPVRLPVGFRRVVTEEGSPTLVEVREAWVRELTGEHEEKIAKARLKDDISAFIHAVLECGIERLGDSVPTREDIRSLTSADRDYLLLEIARATYGDEVTYENVTCVCGEQLTVTISLEEDVPVKRLDSLEESDFDIRLKSGKVARASLPLVSLDDDIAKASTPAEVNTALVAHCVEEVRGPKGTTRIAGDLDAARRLGVRDRQDIVVGISEHTPGPQYNDVRFKHEPDGCGEEIRLQVSVGDMFRGM